MANNWRDDDDLMNELEPISSLTVDLAESADLNRHYYRGLPGRRRKAAAAITVVWSGTIALHLVSWGYWFVLGLTALLGIQALRIVLARPLVPPAAIDSDDPADYPFVSLLVAAKNEEAVISALVEDLCSLDYPSDRYEVWIIDDNSSDRTPIVLKQLAQTHQQLQIMRRSADATGGKSGALNQVLALTQGEILAVFDADAQVTKDLLRRVVPLFDRPQVGAVQVRKAIANARTNFLTRGQMAEMAVDSYMQQQRIAVGGIGELRGNGQFVRRSALERCGGWNEQTITDDLDLTLRLHLDHWDIDFVLFPAVAEEGVTRSIGLWHQRSRWAEGGYQRYLDYWRLIVRNRMGLGKTADLLSYWVIQYILPTAAVPDVLMAIARSRPPVLTPLSSLGFSLFLFGMFTGLRRIQTGEPHEPAIAGVTGSVTVPSHWITLLQTLRGTIYMLHWLVVMPATTARMSIRQKRLKWVKTVHHGADWLDVAEPRSPEF